MSGNPIPEYYTRFLPIIKMHIYQKNRVLQLSHATQNEPSENGVRVPRALPSLLLGIAVKQRSRSNHSRTDPRVNSCPARLLGPEKGPGRLGQRVLKRGSMTFVLQFSGGPDVDGVLFRIRAVWRGRCHLECRKVHKVPFPFREGAICGFGSVFKTTTSM